MNRRYASTDPEHTRKEGGDKTERCNWYLCNEKMMRYHDEEWGMPLHDGQKRFEFLMMEMMQYGLNWNMMIQKREISCQCFDGFNCERITLYAKTDVERILTSEGMIRPRRKMEAVIHSVRRFQAVGEEFGSFSRYLWGLPKEKTLLHSNRQKGKIPVKNSLSDEMSKDLKHRDFKYLGSVTICSHLQAYRIVNDHRKECFRYQEIVEQHPVARKWDQ